MYILNKFIRTGRKLLKNKLNIQLKKHKNKINIKKTRRKGLKNTRVEINKNRN